MTYHKVFVVIVTILLLLCGALVMKLQNGPILVVNK